jgi:hypothetical protein
MFCTVEPLQPARVDEHVEEVPDQRQGRRQDIDEAGKKHEREGGEHQPELQRPRSGEATCDDRAASCAVAHESVDVAVEVVVQGARSSAGECAASQYDEQLPQARHTLGTDEHSRGRGDQEEHHDARLGELDVISPGARRHAFSVECRRRGKQRCGEGQSGEYDMQRGRPPRMSGQCDDPTQGAFCSDQAKRCDRDSQQRPMGGRRGNHDRDQQRRGQHDQRLVGKTKVERAADDDEGGDACGSQSR